MQMTRGRQLADVTARLKPLQTPVLSLVPPIAPAIGPAPKVGNLDCRSPLLLTGEAVTFPHVPLHLNPRYRLANGPEMPASQVQVQLVQQPWEKPTSSSSRPWTGQAGKPLHERGKVLGVSRQAEVSLLIILSRGGSTGTGDTKGLESLGLLSCLLLRSACPQVANMHPPGRVHIPS